MDPHAQSFAHAVKGDLDLPPTSLCLYPEKGAGGYTFETENAVFDEHRDGLVHVLGDRTGWHALICGDEIVGVYPSTVEAFDVGISRFGPFTFMIKEVAAHDRPIWIAPTLLG